MFARFTVTGPKQAIVDSLEDFCLSDADDLDRCTIDIIYGDNPGERTADVTLYGNEIAVLNQLSWCATEAQRRGLDFHSRDLGEDVPGEPVGDAGRHDLSGLKFPPQVMALAKMVADNLAERNRRP